MGEPPEGAENQLIVFPAEVPLSVTAEPKHIDEGVTVAAVGAGGNGLIVIVAVAALVTAAVAESLRAGCEDVVCGGGAGELSL